MNETKELLIEFGQSLDARSPGFSQSILLPGLTPKKAARRFGKLSGDSSHLVELYSWRDGTRFVQLQPGETYASAIAKVSIVPSDKLTFIDSERSVAMMATWAEAAKTIPALLPGVNRYFPILNGQDEQFLFDLSTTSPGRILYYNNSSKAYIREAYVSLNAFLAQMITSNRTGSRLEFYTRGAK